MPAVSVLIVTCPCGLAIAVPAVRAVAAGALFRRGVLVASGSALERLAEADHAVLDKTGTLTEGRPSLLPDPARPAAALAAAAVWPAPAATRWPAPWPRPARTRPPRRAWRRCRARPARRRGAAGQRRLRRRRRRADRRSGGLGRCCGGAPARTRRPSPSASPTRPGRTPRRQWRRCAARPVGRDPVRRRAPARWPRSPPRWAWRSGAPALPRPPRRRGCEALRAAGRRPLMVGDGINDAAAMALAHASASPGGAATSRRTPPTSCCAAGEDRAG